MKASEPLDFVLADFVCRFPRTFRLIVLDLMTR